jgi:hypothetical protein
LVSANQYEPTTESVMKPTDRLPKKLATAEMRPRLAVILLFVSLAALAWLWVGGLISYAPGAVSANEVQNIHLSRIMGYGLLSGVLQLAAISLIVTQRRSTDDARTVAEQCGERDRP